MRATLWLRLLARLLGRAWDFSSGTSGPRLEAFVESVVRLLSGPVGRRPFAVRREQTVRCVAGCSACCLGAGTVIVSFAEISRIARYLEGISSANGLGRLRDRISERAKDLRARPGGRDLRHAGACVFLKDEMCSIYPVRPILCAAFTSFDRAACEAALSANEPVSTSIVPVELGRWSCGVNAQRLVLRLAKWAQLPSGRYDLITALAIRLNEGPFVDESALAPALLRAGSP